MSAQNSSAAEVESNPEKVPNLMAVPNGADVERIQEGARGIVQILGPRKYLLDGQEVELDRVTDHLLVTLRSHPGRPVGRQDFLDDASTYPDAPGKTEIGWDYAGAKKHLLALQLGGASLVQTIDRGAKAKYWLSPGVAFTDDPEVIAAAAVQQEAEATPPEESVSLTLITEESLVDTVDTEADYELIGQPEEERQLEVAPVVESEPETDYELDFVPQPEQEVEYEIEPEAEAEFTSDHEVETEVLAEPQRELPVVPPSPPKTISKQAAPQPRRKATPKISSSSSIPVGSASGQGSRRRAKANGPIDKDDDIVHIYLTEIGRYPLLTKDDEVRLAKLIEAGVAAQARKDAEWDNLDPVERRQVRKAIRAGEDASREFVQSNLRLVVSIAKKYQASGVPLMDLVQEGNTGLMHSVEKFDWRKGFKFSTYATWWIRQAITRGIANTGRTIRLPVHAGDTLTRLQKTRFRLEHQLGRPATIAELAADMEMTEAKVTEAMIYAAEPLSLSEPLREDGNAELGDIVKDSEAQDPFEAAARAMLPDQIAEMLTPLNERERAILRLRFGLDGDEPRTLEEVGEHFNLTRERIRQIEARSMSKLRHPSAGMAKRSFMGS